ncbi:MAG: hypothetical protein RR778_15250 [Glutamicibacter sp.]|uniref:hypothetical protein n=1 Tax=Glutamicibacter sp. TaxID=1931995 RepID=UPI002FC8CD9F
MMRQVFSLSAGMFMPRLGFPLAVVLAVLSAGCEPHLPPKPSVRLAAAETRTVVPLVRPIALVPMSAPMVVDFELQAPGPNSSKSLMLGFRVFGSDRDHAMEIADAIQKEGLEAEVRLTKLDAVGEHLVIIERRVLNGYGPTKMVSVSADGRVPVVVISTPDSTALDAVGLADSEGSSMSLAFAWAFRTTPGRYRLSVRLRKVPEKFSNVEAELLLAYMHKPK